MDPITLIAFILGFVFLISGAELLVRGASNLAKTIGISPLVVGLTIVAFGTSAPELAVNIQSTWTSKPDLAVGNIIGSNILNILLVLGIGAIIAPLSISQRLIRLEVPLMIGASFALLLLSIDGKLDFWDGLLMFSAIVIYAFFSIKMCRQDKQPEHCSSEQLSKSWYQKFSVIIQLGLIIVGLGLLVQGSQWLVEGAVVIAKLIGISELIIGLTIVSIGTSLPEVATVVIASLRGEPELVVGNVVGSNLFNILLVLGFTSLIAPDGIEVSHTAIVFDMPVMIAVAVACLPIFFVGYMIKRWEGILFLAFYVAYTLYLFLNATQHSSLSAFNAVMFWFVIPLTAVTLLALAWRDSRSLPPTNGD